ncbi:MAG TPA: hypothetical protein VLV49_08025 [Terriglobales bacterium]|nr:hypothetical protein [Terriglobales bacterium]
MGRLLLIDALAAFALAGAWYVFFTRYNRRRGVQALHWLEAACLGEGRILDARWFGPSRLEARLRFATRWFEHARVTVNLFPRPIPYQWLLSVCRKQKETLTFEADLDYVPGFSLEVFRHRWFTHQPENLEQGSRSWVVSRPGPVVFTTRPQWTHELPPVVNTFAASRGHSLLRVKFRSESPHLAATVAFEALSDDRLAASFLNVLRDLAADASTSRQ